MFESSVAQLHAIGGGAREAFDEIIDDQGGASQDDLAAVLTAARAARNAIEAVELATLAQLGRREDVVTREGPVVRVRPLGVVDPFAVSLAAMALGASTAAAGRQMSLGARLASRLPGTLRLMAAGTLDLGRACRVERATEGLSEEVCREAEDQFLGRLAELEPSRVGAEVRRAVHRVAPQEQRESVTRERASRDVDIFPGPDGTTLWWAQLPAETSAAMWAAITARAAELRGHDKELTAGQARADAFSDLVLAQATISASLTLGLPVVDAASAIHCPPAAPGDPFIMASAAATVAGVDCWVSGVDIPKVGHVPPEAVARLLGGVDVRVGRALLEAETGVLRETVTDAYRPPRRVREFVTLRDGTCRMFGCTRPAVLADIDHAVPWPRGATAPAGLSGLCRRHHRTKQQARWRYALDADGVATWTSPTGVTRRTYPEAMLIPPPPEPHQPHHPEPHQPQQHQPQQPQPQQPQPPEPHQRQQPQQQQATPSPVTPARSSRRSLDADVGPPPF